MSEQWKHSLLGCCSDVSICLHGCLCPCHLYAKNAEKLSDAPVLTSCLTWLVCMPCLCVVHGKKRTEFRKRYRLQEDINDTCATCLPCSVCSNCQEAREMEERGPPPSQSM